MHKLQIGKSSIKITIYADSLEQSLYVQDLLLLIVIIDLLFYCKI